VGGGASAKRGTPKKTDVENVVEVTPYSKFIYIFVGNNVTCC